MDLDIILKDAERRIKLRALQAFEDELLTPREAEREFALAALDLLYRQPAMSEVLELES